MDSQKCFVNDSWGRVGGSRKAPKEVQRYCYGDSTVLFVFSRVSQVSQMIITCIAGTVHSRLISLYLPYLTRYGVIHGTGEMEPLDKGMEEEEDEDMTVFDRKAVKWPK